MQRVNENSVSLMLTHEVNDLLSSHFDTNIISGFSHSRIFADGSRAELWSNCPALEYTYIKKNLTIRSHAAKLYDKEEKMFFLIDIMQEFQEKTKANYEEHLHDQRELFSLDNIFIMRGSDEICDEIFVFYGPKNLAKTRIYILNNLHNIKGFINNYKDKAKVLIKRAEEDRIIRPWLIKNTNDIRLTKREKEIAQLITHGHTAEYIANILNLSKYTITNYTEKLKDKYDCENKKSLVLTLRKQADLFDNAN